MFTDSYTPYVSGVVRSIQRFSRGLTTMGHTVYIFAPGYGKSDSDGIHSEAAQIFRFYSVPAPTFPDFSIPIPITIKAEKLIRSLEIEVIHTHSPFMTGSLGATLAKRTELPLVFTHHTLYHEYTHYVPAPQTLAKQVCVRYLQRYCRKCDHIIAPTPLIKKLIIDLYAAPGPISILPSGIEVNQYSQYSQAENRWLHERFSIDDQSRILLTVGRLNHEKNPQLVLEAFANLRPHERDLHLVFVGEGREHEILAKQAEDHGFAERVHFTGILDAADVIQCYCSADLFLFASETETQGLVTAEAMAGRLPVVAVRSTGSSDLVIHGHNGYLTAPDASEMARYAAKILEDAELYQSLAANSQKTAADYSVEATCQKLVDIYRSAGAL